MVYPDVSDEDVSENGVDRASEVLRLKNEAATDSVSGDGTGEESKGEIDVVYSEGGVMIAESSANVADVSNIQDKNLFINKEYFIEAQVPGTDIVFSRSASSGS